MSEKSLQRLTANIRREGNYPPLIVRPDPEKAGSYQLLDGHQRWQALKTLGHTEACCYVWSCDDATALLLLGTLNRLRGQDDPPKRAELLRELTKLASPEELMELLPDSATVIGRSVERLAPDLEDLLTDLRRESEAGNGLREVRFTVNVEDERVIKEAVRRATASLPGRNRRGRALAQIAKAYLGGD